MESQETKDIRFTAIKSGIEKMWLDGTITCTDLEHFLMPSPSERGNFVLKWIK